MAAFALGPDATAAGYRLCAFDEIESTSATARALARAGEAGPLWIAATRQRAGYGRRGSAWRSPEGNLTASLLVTRAVTAAEAATVGFVAGLALRDALAAAAPALAGSIRLKWPNDVLIGGAKLAGILVEAEEVAAGRAIVVGIGVNVAAAPADLPYPAASLADCGAAVTADALFAALAEAWVPLARAWDADGFGALRAAWLASAMGLGGPISARLGEDIVAGTFETVDDGGRLIVRGRDGAVRTITAADVQFGAARSLRDGEAA